MTKKLFRLSILLVLFLCFAFGSQAWAAGAPNATLFPYTVSNSIISPATSTAAQDDSTIDIEFSAEVADVSMDIVDGGDNLVKHIYNNTVPVTNPNPKVWDGKDSGSNFVTDGIYTVQIVYADAGGVATDTSNTITVDNTPPLVGPILFTPSIMIDPTHYILGSVTTISASSTDDNLNPDTCRYSIDAGSSSVVDPVAYDASSDSCIFADVDTSAATGVSISINDLGANNFDTSSSWVTITPDLLPPTITLVGDATVNLQVGDSYTDAGATAEDSVEGDLSSQIVTAGTVDTSTVGSYTLTYNVTDSLGNIATEVTRTVNVEAVPSSGSHSTRYVLGANPFLLVNVAKATTTGEVLGASTKKDEGPSAEEQQARQLKKKLNQIRIEIYYLKHPQARNSQGGEVTPVAVTAEIDATNISTTTTSTTTPKKPFWKFW